MRISSFGGEMRLLFVIVVLAVAGCCQTTQYGTLVKTIPPAEGTKITVISDDHIRGFKIVEVLHNNKTHFFLWNYDGDNQGLVKFDEREQE